MLQYKCDEIYYLQFHLFNYRADYNAFWKFLQTGFLYLLIQFVKMMFVATFFPALDDSNFNPLVVSIPSKNGHEFFKYLLAFLDCYSGIN